MIYMGAGEFKTQCLKLMDLTNQNHEVIVITKRGKPVAKLVPFEEEPTSIFGALQGSFCIKGNLLQPMEEEWDAEKI